MGMLASVALTGAILAAFYWQSSEHWLRASPPPEKLTISVIDTYIGSGLVHIAAAKGFFAAEGLEVSLQPHSGGGAALDAVLQNKADMTTIGNLPVMFATVDKAPVSIVATIASASRGAGIVARRDRGISGAEDLKGKSIGATLKTDGHFALSVILAGHGIAPGDIRTEDVKPEAMLAALSTGRVDAIATWEPALSNARNALGAQGVAIELDRGYTFWFHLAGKRDFVRAHPLTMQKLLRALLRAERYIEENPAAAYAIVADATKMAQGAFGALWPNFRLHIALPQGVLTMLEDQARWAIANRYIAAAEPPNFLDTVYLDGLLAIRPDAVSIVR